MNQISIIAEPDTVRTSPGGSATANIWLEINGIPFPGDRWNDFAVVVMGWWAAALLRLVRGSTTQETVDFMDGPYAMNLTLTPAGTLQFHAFKGADRNNELAAGEAPALPFIQRLISQSREVLNACKQQGWWSEDAEILQSSLEALSKESAELPN